MNFKTNNVFAETFKIKIIVNEASIYIEPDINSEIYNIKIPHKTVIDAIDFDNNFYKLTYKDQTGFILKVDAMEDKLSSPTRRMVFNAVIKNDATIYKLEDNKYINTYFEKLKKGTEIKLVDGYKKDRLYTLISYYNNENEIETFYVETKNIKTYGFPKVLFISISLIIFSVSIILILFGTKFRKQKA